jgi:hypothetical protein
MNDDNQKKFETQTNEIYQEIGRFAVQFEMFSHGLQTGIQNVLHKAGLANHNLTNIILADQTARPLKMMLQAMLAEIGNYDDTDRSIVNIIFAEVDSIIEKRNEIIHSTWFIGWAAEGQTDFGSTESLKYTKGKLGVGIKSFTYTASAFTELIEECELITKKVNRLWSVVWSGRKVSNNFIVKSKVVTLPEGA